MSTEQKQTKTSDVLRQEIDTEISKTMAEIKSIDTQMQALRDSQSKLELKLTQLKHQRVLTHEFPDWPKAKDMDLTKFSSDELDFLLAKATESGFTYYFGSKGDCRPWTEQESHMARVGALRKYFKEFTCGYCRLVGHQTKVCPTAPKISCHVCGKIGHKAQHCRTTGAQLYRQERQEQRQQRRGQGFYKKRQQQPTQPAFTAPRDSIVPLPPVETLRLSLSPSTVIAHDS